MRTISLCLLIAYTLLVSGCSGGDQSRLPPVDDSRGGRPAANAPAANAPQAAPGMSTGKKVVLLAGAAALYYLYEHHKAEAGQNQYYMSKNGRVYYRDAQHRAHYVTPPPQGIQVPANEAQKYQGFQGYENSPQGKDLTNVGNDPNEEEK